MKLQVIQYFSYIPVVFVPEVEHPVEVTAVNYRNEI